jgi:23S rRNA (guanosine2251-2'-O)-methyltransferase
MHQKNLAIKIDIAVRDLLRPKLTFAHMKKSLEALGRISVSEFRESSKTPVCILLDNLRSLHNVGSAFRTADAFRLDKIVLTGITGTPPHREIQKTALGATESVAWSYVSDPREAVRMLKGEGYEIVIVEQTTASISLHLFVPVPNQKYCLVFGNEVDGVSSALVDEADVVLEIPQSGTKHSLNVSVCLGIVVWDIFQKLNYSQLPLPGAAESISP